MKISDSLHAVLAERVTRVCESVYLYYSQGGKHDQQYNTSKLRNHISDVKGKLLSSKTRQIVTIDGLYNGASKVANGGYICGLLASFIDGDAEVRINASFPVETPLEAVATEDGGIEIYLDNKLLGRAQPTTVQMDIPTSPDFESARRASENFVFLHSIDARGCYVCSPIRTPDKGLRVFIGGLDNITERSPGQNLVAALWRPTQNLTDSKLPENKLPENKDTIDNVYVWSVLDCPGVYALKLRYPQSGILVLGSCSASIKRPLPVNQTYIVSAWQDGPAEGRKLRMGVAIHSTDGELMACAKQICFDVGDALPGTPKN